MTIEHKVAMITCKDCEQKFILMAVFKEHAETYTCVETYNTTILQQEKCYYCPFCGKDQREQE